MGSRLNRTNKAILEKLPEKLLRHLYQVLDMADREIAVVVGVKRTTVKKMRDFYGIPKTPKLKKILAWHANRDKEDVKASAKKNWDNQRAKGTLKTGRVPKSAFRPGNDNGKAGKTHKELFGEERAKQIDQQISDKLKGQSAGTKNPMYGKPPLNKKNNHRGGHVDSPLRGKVWMRSSWEIEYASYLTSQGIQWLYEPQCFELGTDFTYRPDFYLPDTDEWKEVKGYMTERDRKKLELMQSVHGIQVDVISWYEMQSMGLRIRPAHVARDS